MGFCIVVLIMLYNKTCTIFHFGDNDNLEKQIYNDRCYYNIKNMATQGHGLESSKSITALILNKNNLLPIISVGDLFVPDLVNEDYALERDLRRDYKTFTILYVENCTQGNVKHVYIQAN